jgi:hypothetical protein
MGIFRRGTGDERTGDEKDLATIVLQGEDMMAQLAEAHRSWGLGSAERWQLDQETGLITWLFADRTATAPAQILASYNADAESWLWAWANDSVLPDLRRDSEIVRDWAAANGHVQLTAPALQATPDVADTLTAISLRVTRATGFYRGQGTSAPLITFGPVTVTLNDDGEPTTFSIAIED